uniref:Ig-like domain-containing protein n=1 Tax=Gadus morhua TaxID=8049 RepID=A0A8C5CSY4_GADMO
AGFSLRVGLPELYLITKVILLSTDAPKTPTVSVRSPPGVIKEGSSVSLTCSSEANPVAKYTCYVHGFLSLGCTYIIVFMTDAPKTPSVSVRPPGEIKEGGSVTLSCSSDANPAANYTWFKDNQPLPWEPSRPYTLDSVSSKDRGTYRCQAENQYGYLGSNSVFIDVLCELETIIIVTSLARKREDNIKPGIFGRVK